MIWVCLLMVLFGLGLSAFFSGSETGFYRVARLRLAFDAREGDLVSKLLLYLTNNPSLFVATTLIGNNLANYLLSLGILLFSRTLAGDDVLVEMTAPLIASPFVFVYAELLPKNIFYLAPNQLLKLGGPFFLICAILFAPISIVLWVLARLLQAVIGEAPEAVQLRLARTELRRLLDAGGDFGILLPAQQRMVQAVFDSPRLTLPRRYPTQMVRVSKDAATATVRDATQRSRNGQALVYESRTRAPIGYVQFAELPGAKSGAGWNEVIRPLSRVSASDSPLTAIMRLRDDGQTLGALVDQQSRIVGIIELPELVERVLGGTA